MEKGPPRGEDAAESLRGITDACLDGLARAAQVVGGGVTGQGVSHAWGPSAPGEIAPTLSAETLCKFEYFLAAVNNFRGASVAAPVAARIEDQFQRTWTLFQRELERIMGQPWSDEDSAAAEVRRCLEHACNQLVADARARAVTSWNAVPLTEKLRTWRQTREAHAPMREEVRRTLDSIDHELRRRVVHYVGVFDKDNYAAFLDQRAHMGWS